MAACVADVAAIEEHLTPPRVTELLTAPAASSSSNGGGAHQGGLLPGQMDGSRNRMSSNQGRGGGHGRMSRLASDEFMPEGGILMGSAPLVLSPIQKASLLVIEANLSHEAIRAACVAAAGAAVPVFMEPVSVPKAIRQDFLFV